MSEQLAAIQRERDAAQDLVRRADIIINALLLGRNPKRVKDIDAWIDDSRDAINDAVDRMQT